MCYAKFYFLQISWELLHRDISDRLLCIVTHNRFVYLDYLWWLIGYNPVDTLRHDRLTKEGKAGRVKNQRWRPRLEFTAQVIQDTQCVAYWVLLRKVNDRGKSRKVEIFILRVAKEGRKISLGRSRETAWRNTHYKHVHIIYDFNAFINSPSDRNGTVFWNLHRAGA